MSYDNIMVLCSLLFLTAYNNYFSVCTYVCVLVLMLLVSICWSLDVVDGRCPDTGLCVQGWSIRQVWVYSVTIIQSSVLENMILQSYHKTLLARVKNYLRSIRTTSDMQSILRASESR